jgi:hypothetical protein
VSVVRLLAARHIAIAANNSVTIMKAAAAEPDMSQRRRRNAWKSGVILALHKVNLDNEAANNK